MEDGCFGFVDRESANFHHYGAESDGYSSTIVAMIDNSYSYFNEILRKIN
jgi:hypothetical protein